MREQEQPDEVAGRIQIRYPHLNLTTSQALQILQYELDRDTPTDEHYFSQWEEWDFEKTTFGEILDHDQLVIYEQELKERIIRHEQHLQKDDQEKIPDITRQQEALEFYQQKFLPALIKDALSLIGSIRRFNNTKIDFLKAEYKRFLLHAKKELLTTHFRYNRSFSPNILKASLLQHQRLYLVPDYRGFKYKMDEPTRAAARYLEMFIARVTDEMEQPIAKRFEELHDFHEKLSVKYTPKRGGWHVIIDNSPEEDKRITRLMCVLLIDEKFYTS